MAVGAIWNLSKFTGSTGTFLYSFFLESRSVLGDSVSSAYNTSTGASKIVQNHYQANFKISQSVVLPLIRDLIEKDWNQAALL